MIKLNMQDLRTEIEFLRLQLNSAARIAFRSRRLQLNSYDPFKDEEYNQIYDRYLEALKEYEIAKKAKESKA